MVRRSPLLHIESLLKTGINSYLSNLFRTIIEELSDFCPIQNFWSEDNFGPDFCEIDCTILKAKSLTETSCLAIDWL